MPQKSYREALREAMREELKKDPDVFIMGEDIGLYGGCFKVTQGLLEEFGPQRIKDTPLSESVIVGAAAGAALLGKRPIAEIMFADFLPLVLDQFCNNAAQMSYLYNGAAKVPLVLRTQQGAGTQSGAHHSQCLEAIFLNFPGLKIVMPSTPYDAKGLLKSAVRDNNPVLFLEHKLLYNTTGEVPDEEYYIPLGKADIKQEGEDLTIIATSAMVIKALKAAEQLSQEGVRAEVIDPMTIAPLDGEALITSIQKTKRVLVVHEARQTGGAGAEIAAFLGKEAFDYLDAPIERIGAPHIPVPFSPTLEKYYLPGEEQIIKTALQMM